MKRNQNKKLIRRIAIKAILRWLMFKTLAIGIAVYSITYCCFWSDGSTIAQKVVSIIIGVWVATMLFIGSRFDDILDDVILHIKKK